MTGAIEDVGLPLDAEQELAAANRTIVGEAPTIQSGPDTGVSLAVGLVRDGVASKDAEVRELMGADEERMAKMKNQVEFFSTVVCLGTVRIGSVDLQSKSLSERRAILGELLAGDRDRLFLEISRVSFGNERDVGFVCPSCGKEQEATLLLSEDFPQKEVDGEVIHYYTTAKGDKIKYRLVTSADQDDLGTELSGAELNTLLLSKCILEVNNQMVLNPQEYARNLGIRDRRSLLAEMGQKQPTIQFDLTTECVACGKEVPLSVGWETLFQF